MLSFEHFSHSRQRTPHCWNGNIHIQMGGDILTSAVGKIGGLSLVIFCAAKYVSEKDNVLHIKYVFVLVALGSLLRLFILLCSRCLNNDNCRWQSSALCSHASFVQLNLHHIVDLFCYFKHNSVSDAFQVLLNINKKILTLWTFCTSN